MKTFILLFFGLAILPSAAEDSGVLVEGDPNLDFAQVVFVTVTRYGDELWRFDTTVRHQDEGWNHYADAWQVVAVGPDGEEGEVLAERVLVHPHDNEQPFTRSLSGIKIPAAMERVLVRAKCGVHGFGGQALMIDLSEGEGEHFRVRYSK